MPVIQYRFVTQEQHSSIFENSLHYFIFKTIYFFLQEGVWVWTDGTAFDYTYWFAGQPDNSNGIEDCLSMNYLGFSL